MKHQVDKPAQHDLKSGECAKLWLVLHVRLIAQIEIALLIYFFFIF